MVSVRLSHALHYTPGISVIENASHMIGRKWRQLRADNPKMKELMKCRHKPFDASGFGKAIFEARHEALRSGNPSKCRKISKQLIAQAEDPHQIWKMMKVVTDLSLDAKDPAAFKYLESLIDYELLINVLKNKDPQFGSLLSQAKIEIDPATRNPKSYEKGERLGNAKSFYRSVIDILPQMLDVLCDTLMKINDNSTTTGMWEIYLKCTILFKLLSLPFEITKLLLMNVTPLWLALTLIAGIFLSCLAAIGVYLRWLTPMPSRLPESENMTDKALKGEFPPLVERENELKTILECVGSSKQPQSKMHVLIVSERGSGKSALLEGIASELAKRRPEMRTFSVSPYALTYKDVYGKASVLQELERRIGIRRGASTRIVLEFDEMHTAVEKGTPEYLGKWMDQKTTMMIGATTPEGLEKLKKFPAFLERFKIIKLKEPSELPLNRIIQHRVQFSAGNVAIDEKVYEDAISLCKKHLPKRKAPRIVVQVLEEAINKVSLQIETGAIKSKKLIELEKELSELKKTFVIEPSRSSKPWKVSPQALKIKELEKELKKEFKSLKTARVSLKRLLDLRGEERRLLRRQVLLSTKIISKNKKSQQKDFLFNKYVLIPRLIREINQLEKLLAPTIDVKVKTELVKKIVLRKKKEMPDKMENKESEGLGENQGL